MCSRTRTSAGLAIVAFAVTCLWAAAGRARFLRFDEVRDIIAGFAASGAPVAALPDAGSWDLWIRERDHETRARIDRGVEDSISNLILYGSSFTTLPRIEGAELASAREGNLTGAARARVLAFASALARQPDNERLRFAAAFLARRGVAGPAIQSLLLTNLARLAAEQHAYRETLETAGKSGDSGQVLFTRSTLFRERGLSVDTSLVPNFALEDTLRAMMRKGALSSGGIHSIAIIGPGLDFTDKRDGYDYYPLQTIQPFAILEAVARLRLGDAGKVQVTAFDLNPTVIAHIRGIAQRGRAGQSYRIQLPRDIHAGWTPEALAYWQHFGDIIGSPVAALAVPASLKLNVAARAVAIQPRYAARMTAGDLDIVAQTMDVEPGAGFDLVVATNILVYYDLFQQALAKAAIARMMNPGGLLLVNHALPREPASALEYLGRRNVSYSATGAYGDDMVVYRRP
jgi:hypothetical protein